ncbi:hypothetical protein AMATHDRAFT_143085 [Amanita thiersii Skay4041]|uniref:Uncharacterized protein n=1 Tax=Amanita thiersii Skay4041 TaxID=703135 RepID=A0A2A9NSH3_9AGAR|nr:hypothetical protein AMATHDRAFT_143085 [Amanita thiersii Skay4041]
MSPLAGRPPFATDEPDSIYETPQPTRKLRKPAPENPNKRTSAYDMYDNYLGAGNQSNDASRQSGVGALGMGLLTMDDDDMSDDEGPAVMQPSAPVSNKHAALAAAAAPPPINTNKSLPPPNQHDMKIAAPRPGYAAPIAALNLSRPEPAVSPQTRSGQQQLQNPFIRPSLENPFNPPHPGAIRAQYAAASPAPSLPPQQPHPLQPPMTPIMPVFARPAKSSAITFEEKPKIPRTEGTVLPSRGEKGDDFWKRFSMIAKEPNSHKESNWLKKTRSGSSRLNRWVWVVGILLLLCIAGAIVLGVFASRNHPGHQPPKALGGSANEAAPVTSSAPAQGTGTASRSLHVSPTHTVARRDVWETDTPIPSPAVRAFQNRNKSRKLSTSSHRRLVNVAF